MKMTHKFCSAGVPRPKNPSPLPPKGFHGLYQLCEKCLEKGSCLREHKKATELQEYEKTIGHYARPIYAEVRRGCIDVLYDLLQKEDTRI